nr:glycosyltransferase family 2 protein [Deinococcus sp. JMULE3]
MSIAVSLPSTTLGWVLLIIVTLLLLKAVLTVTLAFAHARTAARRRARAHGTPLPGVSVMIAAYNEEVGIADTLRSVLAQQGPALQVLVVDDGSTDATAAIAEDFARSDPRVTVLRKPNGGKASALNLAADHLTYPVAVSVDADSALAPGTLAALARHFHDPRVGAVAGDVRVAGPVTSLTQMQNLEYSVGQQMEKRAQDMLGAVSVVPGAAGAFRSDLIRRLRYSHDTITEDMDLTVAIAAEGYEVRFEPGALSYTEPPVDLRSLWRQRMRWMYGTFQVMGKYRHLIMNPRGGRLGWLTLPYVLVYGLTLGGAGPIFDLAALALLTQHMNDALLPLLLNVGADVAVAAAALLLGRQSLRPLLITPTQRLFLRPFVSLVVVMTCVTFLRRRNVQWNKLPRVGLRLPGAAPTREPLPQAGD